MTCAEVFNNHKTMTVPTIYNLEEEVVAKNTSGNSIFAVAQSPKVVEPQQIPIQIRGRLTK